jgi:hypothetical protein
VLSCQYHPEASPGPHDSRPWFSAFASAVARRRGESLVAAVSVPVATRPARRPAAKGGR